ncbi:ABC transporter ATP-binding protein [Roseospira goensis]|uniref:Subfamily B ATP-binding cassette protein MsbA n=1 Tax=Roseospira goensis TaxID=391922 RepID=A0A7W6RZ00_9PROT|nr:ABC transporter ATP-binding protein [Roseospira goensis]MBB4285147.1 subfamily B ATP-binding cassette protein MsbA [Roseospira goensis]
MSVSPTVPPTDPPAAPPAAPTSARASAPAGRAGTLALARRLIRTFLRPYWGRMGLAVACMVVMALATAATAWLLEPAINEVFLGRNAAALWWVGGGILAAFVLRAIGNYGQSVLVTRVGFLILAEARDRLHAKVSAMELRFFQGHSTGDLVTRFTFDINRMRFATANALTGLGRDLVTLVALVALVLWQDWVLGLLAFLAAPLTVVPVRRLGRKVRKRARHTQEETGRLHALMTQTLRGIRVVWIDGRADDMRARVDTLIERIFRRQVSGERARTLITPIMELATGIALGLALFVGGQRILSGANDPGSLTSMLAALLMAYQPAKRLANLYSIVQEGLAAVERLFAVLDTPPDITERPGAVALPPGPGRLELAGVHFGYGPDAPVLHGIDLSVAPGEVVALVGASGAGKSTLLNLIPRFLDVSAGAVRIDGHDVRDVTLASLRARIALVTQETFLFDDTIRANIAYGRPDASAAEIEAAARDADAWDFIARLPAGLDTRIGDLGGRLSGGERQRLAIARAILKEADILLLDEPTSALDTEAERRVQRALAALSRGRTTLVVAHRLSTIRDADRICVLEAGRIVEQGRHGDLLAKGGLYTLFCSGEATGGGTCA